MARSRRQDAGTIAGVALLLLLHTTADLRAAALRPASSRASASVFLPASVQIPSAADGGGDLQLPAATAAAASGGVGDVRPVKAAEARSQQLFHDVDSRAPLFQAAASLVSGGGEGVARDLDAASADAVGEAAGPALSGGAAAADSVRGSVQRQASADGGAAAAARRRRRRSLLAGWAVAAAAGTTDGGGGGTRQRQLLQIYTACQEFSGYEVLPNSDHNGDDVRQVPPTTGDGGGGGDLATAAAECDAAPACRGFNSDGWLKAKVTPVQYKSEYCLYVKTGAPPSPLPPPLPPRPPPSPPAPPSPPPTVCPQVAGYNARPDEDHPGDNINSTDGGSGSSTPGPNTGGATGSGANLTRLAEQCVANLACRGFNSEGWLKLALAPTQRANGICLYVKNPPPPAPPQPPRPPAPSPPPATVCANVTGFSAKADVDHTGDDIALFAKDLPAAAAACLGSAKCKGFNSDGWTKSAVGSTAKRPGYCLYVKAPQPPPRPPSPRLPQSPRPPRPSSPPPRRPLPKPPSPRPSRPSPAPSPPAPPPRPPHPSPPSPPPPPPCRPPLSPMSPTPPAPPPVLPPSPPQPPALPPPTPPHQHPQPPPLPEPAVGVLSQPPQKLSPSPSPSPSQRPHPPPLLPSPPATVCKPMYGFSAAADLAHVGDKLASYVSLAAAAGACSTDWRCRGFDGEGRTLTAVTPTVPARGACLYTKK